jgi:CheY-like chemotaxis protein
MLDWQNPATWRVLVVDDEPDNLEVVAETLEFHGVSVKTAKDGLDGLSVMKEFKPNLILLDLSMPKMNGWEARTHIKADASTAHVPIIALTAHAMAGDAERALAAGFDGYMIKPVNILTLINDIRTTVVKQPAVQPVQDSAVAALQVSATALTDPKPSPTSNQQIASKEPQTS